MTSKKSPSKEALLWSRKKNPPLMDPPEADLLIKYAEKCDVHFVEIGTHKGGSTSLISKHLPQNITVTTIDTFEKPPIGSSPPQEKPPSLKEARETIEREGEISKVKIIKGVSWEIGKTWKKPIDILLVDGNHRYEAAKKDFDNWKPHIVTDGFILLHDINFEGVKRLFKEIRKNNTFSIQEIVGNFAVIKKIK